MIKEKKLISVNELRQIIFSSLGYDDFNIIRGNKLYDRILFDYGYYYEGMSLKGIKTCIFHYNYICKLSNNQFQEKYRVRNEEISQIIKLLKLCQKEK
jgi:hypothetical protein